LEVEDELKALTLIDVQRARDEQRGPVLE